MVLAAAVMDRRGRCLIPAEVALTERHVQALKMWGVAQIDVDSPGLDDGGGASSLSPEESERVREEVTARFGGQPPQHPFVHALLEHAIARAEAGAGELGGGR